MPIDPTQYRPMTQAEVYDEHGLLSLSGMYKEHQETIWLDEIIRFLSHHRDQSLWFSVACDMWHAGAEYWPAQVGAWMLDQDDCDRAIAVLLYYMFDGPYFVGKAIGDPFSSDCEELIPLRIILERNAARPFTVNRLNVLTKGSSYFVKDPDGLSGWLLRRSNEELERLKSKTEFHGTHPETLLKIPENLLSQPLQGTEPFVQFAVGISELYIIPVAISDAMQRSSSFLSRLTGAFAKH